MAQFLKYDLRVSHTKLKKITFPAMLSISIPIVIRDGKAFGLIITSGTIPDSEKGMSI